MSSSQILPLVLLLLLLAVFALVLLLSNYRMQAAYARQWSEVLRHYHIHLVDGFRFLRNFNLQIQHSKRDIEHPDASPECRQALERARSAFDEVFNELAYKSIMLVEFRPGIIVTKSTEANRAKISERMAPAYKARKALKAAWKRARRDILLSARVRQIAASLKEVKPAAPGAQ